MDPTSYCDALESHLSAWKSRIYDVIRVVDRLPAVEKEKVFPSIRSLHRIVDEIDGQLAQLKSACPADWSPNRRSLAENMQALQATLKSLSERVGGPLIPDSLSWVSE
jgi:hypothetical protein